MILKRSRLNLASNYLRRITTANQRRIVDEGDWFYSSEWWGSDGSDANTVFRSISDKGNGIVSVVASHSSRPNESHWPKTENWLRQRYTELHPGGDQNEVFGILGYQWRTLRFNDDTRQSTVKVMAAYKESDPGSLFLRQEAHCLAVPYLKSMVSAGLASVSCNYDLESSVYGNNAMKILCIGHGGGSLPLFLAYKIPGAVIDIVEIDPVVISASTQAMGFPPSSATNHRSAAAAPTVVDQVLWNGIHERLFLHESDAERFLSDSTAVYDTVFVDAYDGNDVFPHKLWDPDAPFLKALRERLHPGHGTVVVNLHSDAADGSAPAGDYVSRVCKAYKTALTQSGGVAFTVSVPWVCNASMVVSRGLGNGDRGVVVNALLSESLKVQKSLNLPFSCLHYVKRDLVFVD